ncbi:GNAT family N-acetyltransferase [Mucilaginibacter sp. HMF5004]|uniref:GNAT family N-acetyltransferase n=1 Tax=Mucilaginibacter rivuli TaxID=2857527 RepID=UPI001C5D793E|nr:GNAT family N-acetyltransferase [Mucilaginibacter rivuli]MBW4888286.1 GNAT family N-acetyltransferase [Mucilaginibacter rivuli]
MPYQIREANIADVGAIINIAQKTWWPTYSPILGAEQITYMLSVLYSTEKISQQIATGEQSFLLLIEDEEPVAFAGYSPRDENPDIYKLHKLYCLPQTQGKGYGKILIDEVCRRVINADSYALDLNVNRYNKAKGFYEKMGFYVIGEEDIPIGDYWMNDYVMRMDL